MDNPLGCPQPLDNPLGCPHTHRILLFFVFFFLKIRTSSAELPAPKEMLRDALRLSAGAMQKSTFFFNKCDDNGVRPHFYLTGFLGSKFAKWDSGLKPPLKSTHPSLMDITPSPNHLSFKIAKSSAQAECEGPKNVWYKNSIIYGEANEQRFEKAYH